MRRPKRARSRMWTPPWLASLTSYRGRWQSGQVRSYVRPLDAALMAAGPYGVREIGSKSETRIRRSSASCWFFRPRLVDRLPRTLSAVLPALSSWDLPSSRPFG